MKKKERQDENEYMDIDDVVGDYLELRAGETSEYENMQELNTIHSNTHVRGRYLYINWIYFLAYIFMNMV